MKVAIVGSREFPRLEKVAAYVGSLSRDTIIVSGGARGVDRHAEEAARRRGMEVRSFPADWERYGKRAGFLRNREIVAEADRVVAFWDGKSKGTAHTIQLAKDAGKLVEVIQP